MVVMLVILKIIIVNIGILVGIIKLYILKYYKKCLEKTNIILL